MGFAMFDDLTRCMCMCALSSTENRWTLTSMLTVRQSIPSSQEVHTWFNHDSALMPLHFACRIDGWLSLFPNRCLDSPVRAQRALLVLHNKSPLWTNWFIDTAALPNWLSVDGHSGELPPNQNVTIRVTVGSLSLFGGTIHKMALTRSVIYSGYARAARHP